jgi:hypothetical protein
MKFLPILFLLSIAIFGCDTATNKPTSTDNSSINQRDKADSAKTPMDQYENQKDVDITAKIRRQVVGYKNVNQCAKRQDYDSKRESDPPRPRRVCGRTKPNRKNRSQRRGREERRQQTRHHNTQINYTIRNSRLLSWHMQFFVRLKPRSMQPTL